MPVATHEHRAAEQAGFRSAGLPSPPRAGTFLLPLGLVDEEERCHREAELRPLSGQEQRMLASFPSSTPVAFITTELLCRCLVRLGSLRVVDRDVVSSLLPGDREFLLLKLYQMTFGNNLLALLSCPAEECGESLEFPLALEECVIEALPVGSRTFALPTSAGGSRSLRFRLPTGADQETLSRLGEIDPDVLRRRLLAACCAENYSAAVDGLGHEECAFLEEQMGRLAPQLEVEVEAACPDCGADFSARIDVPYLALAEMNINEADLDWEVHYLAWHYHWPETEILALTPGRRRRYISLVQRELEGSGDS